MFQHSGVVLRGFYKKQQQVEAAFVKWIEAKYSLLSGVVDRKRPVLLSKVNDFIRKGNDKIALIVMDGMSFENFFTIQRILEHEPFTYDVQASFSFFPTVTSVARQSIFSGKLPQEHSKPFSLENRGEAVVCILAGARLPRSGDCLLQRRRTGNPNPDKSGWHRGKYLR